MKTFREVAYGHRRRSSDVGRYGQSSAVLVVWMLNDVYSNANKVKGVGELHPDWTKKLDNFIKNLQMHPIRGVILGGKGIWWNDDPNDIATFDATVEAIATRLRQAGIVVFDGASCLPYCYRHARKSWHMNACNENANALAAYIMVCIGHCIADSILRAPMPAVVELNDWSKKMSVAMSSANSKKASVVADSPIMQPRSLIIS